MPIGTEQTASVVPVTSGMPPGLHGSSLRGPSLVECDTGRHGFMDSDLPHAVAVAPEGVSHANRGAATRSRAQPTGMPADARRRRPGRGGLSGEPSAGRLLGARKATGQ